MRVRIDITYSTPRGTEAQFSSDEVRVGEAVVIAEDMAKTGRIKEIEFVDQQERIWTLKELKKLLEGIQTEPHEVKLFFDGGYDVQTGQAGLGCAIYYEQNGKAFRLRRNAFVEEMVSNNEAEYAALHFGLKELEELGVHHQTVTITGDSKVVIHQLDGEWPLYEEELSRWADRIEAQLGRLGLVAEYEAISRKSNREADQLATQALNGTEVSSLLELNK